MPAWYFSTRMQNTTNDNTFDQIIDRRGTYASKWHKYRDQDVLPFWVADMDFPPPPPIGAALAISTLVLAASPLVARAWSRRCGRRGKAAPKELPDQSQEAGASVQWRRAE